jgi:hypothetical protein
MTKEEARGVARRSVTRQAIRDAGAATPLQVPVMSEQAVGILANAVVCALEAASLLGES